MSEVLLKALLVQEMTASNVLHGLGRGEQYLATHRALTIERPFDTLVVAHLSAYASVASHAMEKIRA